MKRHTRCLAGRSEVPQKADQSLWVLVVRKRGSRVLNRARLQRNEAGEVCEHIFPIWSLTQPDAAPRIVSAPVPARAAKVRAHHALTAAIIGLTPKIFSTRVKL